MTDRKRINAPGGAFSVSALAQNEREDGRTRKPDAIRKIFLRTGVSPSASGSAYLELETSANKGLSGLKLSCTVHGPRSLPRSAPFSPQIILSTYVKYAPLASKRQNHARDSVERDLSTHLETALRGAVIADRWPKSGVEISVSIIEGDQDREVSKAQGHEVWDTMNLLCGCVTVASAALADAGIDCVDNVAGGVAALVEDKNGAAEPTIVVDPVPAEHKKILAACCVAYLPTRKEITNLWFKGDLLASNFEMYTQLVDRGVYASRCADRVLADSLLESIR